MNFKFDTLAPTQIYHLMTQTVVPRPIAWALTESSEQVFNLAPFSYFTPVSSNPPLLMLLVGKKPSGEIKDTTRNALETGKMVIHIASASSAEAMTATAATLDHGESEVTANNIELVEFDGFSLPRVKECAVAFGCTLYEVKEVGDVPQSLIFAQVETVYISDNVIDKDSDRLKVDALALDPLSRLGGGEYATLSNVFSVARPK
ncbi:flavin reductase family protein [Vibrio splendidus]|uniref:Protein/domain typically associated with flavoprotein oxygenase, DIM6/NTAB family protein n=1 Tax=Vibrio splendidus TaxID=29497 RepID=A0A2N7JQ47_VIBSP|nr:flavin reductase family protein [Vibrio splendidus]PMM51340.1 protein/domain typically associated with flavoprotein oxygenase, DIM6/NTAB family protein [Vibrio splendidus]